MTKDEQITYISSALIAIRDEYYPYHGEDAVAIWDFASDTILTWQTQSASQQAVSPDAQGDAVYCGGCGYTHTGKCPDDSDKRR